LKKSGERSQIWRPIAEPLISIRGGSVSREAALEQNRVQKYRVCRAQTERHLPRVSAVLAAVLFIT
jgi:hypothetical protein